MITSKIKDGEGGGDHAGVRSTKRFGGGLKVYNQEFFRKENRSAVFLNSDFGSAMNQNAAATGTPLVMHNGIDTVAWTGSQISGGKITFDSTDRPYEGTKSVKIDNPSVNDEWQFAGTSIDVSNYVSLTMWVNIDKDWSTGDSIEIFGWDTVGGVRVGTSVLLEDYINETDFDVWQKVLIPLSSMTLSTGNLDAFRMIQIGRDGRAAKWYLDTMELEESGETIPFTVSPPLNDSWEIQNIQFTIVNAFDSTVINGTVPGIPYQGLIGLSTLPTGIVIRMDQDGSSVFSVTVRDLVDLISIPSEVSIVSGSDGTDTWIKLTLKLPSPFRLNGDSKDKVEISISDDLSSLTVLKASVNYSIDVGIK